MKGFAESAAFRGANICYFSRRMSLNSREDAPVPGEPLHGDDVGSRGTRRPFEVPLCLNSGHCLAPASHPFLSAASTYSFFFFFSYLSARPRSTPLPLLARRQVVSDKDRLKSFPRGLAKNIFYDTFVCAAFQRGESICGGRRTLRGPFPGFLGSISMAKW